MITAQLPDGTSLQFPDDTSTEVIQGVVRKQLATAPQGGAPVREPLQAPVDPRSTGIGRTLADQVGQGVPFADEITDGVGAGIAKIYGLATGNNDKSYLELYSEARDNTKERLPAQREANPALSVASNIFGGLATGGAALSGLKTAAPRLAGALETYAAANPYQTAAGIGAASGALYGAGASEGGLEERGADALRGGVAGAITGPLATYVGRNAIAPAIEKIAGTAPVKSALSKISEIFNKKSTTGKAGSSIAAAEQLSDDIPLDMPINTGIAKQEKDIFSKTAGQRTQNPITQRLESDARAGALTAESESAIRQADVQQNREFHTYVDKLAKGLDKGKDPNVLIEGVSDIVNKSAKNAKKSVNSAYDLAREGVGVKIGSREIRQGLWKGVADIRRDNVYDLTQMPKATGVIKRLAAYSKRTGESNISSVKLGELENWRKQATNAINSSQDPTERKFLGEMVGGYDKFMENTAANAVDIGDATAIKAFRNAVRERRQYGQLFEKNKLVKEILGGEKSIDDTVQSLMGAGSIKGKKAMAQNLDAVVKASGAEAQSVQDDLRQAFTLKLFKRAADGFEPNNPNVEKISPAKLKTELESLFINQKSFAEKLYGKDIVEEASKAIKELELISTSQAGVRNPSGSGEWLGRFLKAPGVNRIPGIGIVGRAVEAQKQHVGSAKVAKGLSEFMQEELKPKSTIWSTVAPAGASAATNAGE